MFNWLIKLFKKPTKPAIDDVFEEPISITINGITYTESMTMTIDDTTISFNKDSGNTTIIGELPNTIRKSKIIIGGSIYGDLDVTNCHVEVDGDAKNDVTVTRSTVIISGSIEGDLSATNSQVTVGNWITGDVNVCEE